MKKKTPSRKPKQAPAASTTLVTFLLDRSQSMSAVYDETIGAFNAYLKTLKEEGKGIKFSFVQFDTISIDRLYIAEPIANVPELTRKTFEPRGATPLIDAAFKTIEAVDASLSKYDKKPKVVVAIQTDGQENSSREHTWEELKGLVERKTKEGWEFSFMGTGIDAYDQGARMGVSVANTISTGLSAAEMGSSFRSLASNTAMFSAGTRGSTSYTAHQKVAAGDKFDPGIPSNLGQMMQKVADDDYKKRKSGALDLTPGATSLATPASSRKVVSDFTL